AGTIAEVLLKRGDKVSKGALIARVEAAAPAASPAPAGAPAAGVAPAAAASAAPAARPESAGDTVRMQSPGAGAADRLAQEFNRSTQLLVLGAGPGGYTAAFRAADLGLKVTLVDRWPERGRGSRDVGCIPSK